MIIHNCAQGSPEWHTARAGVITASMFAVARSKVGGLTDQQQIYVDHILSGGSSDSAKVAAGYKATPTSETVKRALAGEVVGDFSDAAKDYAFRLAVERISGEPLDQGFETWQMRRGQELEPIARSLHEVRSGTFVEECGFITTDDGVFGASVDGLIGEDEGCEYKCFLAPEKIRQFHIDQDIGEVKEQVQGGLWITGRKHWTVGLYCPALKAASKDLLLYRIERDEEYIAKMEADLVEFSGLVSAYEKALRG